MPYSHRMISTHMPTQREYDQHNPELKREEQSTRLPFLRHIDMGRVGYRFSLVRFIVLSLAVYGLYSLIT